MRVTGLRRSRKEPARLLGTYPNVPRFCDHPKVWIAPGNRHVLTIEPFVVCGLSKLYSCLSWFRAFDWQAYEFPAGPAICIPAGSTRLVIASPSVRYGGADIEPVVRAIEAVDWGVV